MTRAMPLFAVFALMGAPLAAEVPTGCFTRDYSPGHLAQHPNQHVAQLRLNFVKEAASDYTLVYVTGRFSDQGRARLDRVTDKVFSQTAFCEGERCQVECDGGNFTLARLKGDALTISTDYFTLQAGVDGCEGDSDLAELGGGATRYRLNRAPAASCQDPD